MAEIVEKFIEDVYEDYALLAKTDIFQMDELKAIVKKHKALIYKTGRQQKRPVEFISLIKFELQMLHLIKHRRHMTGYIFDEKIERNITDRVRKLHRVLCYRFPGEVAHWAAHLALLRRLGQYKAMDRLLGRLLQQHGDQPALWSAAGRWHLQERPRLRMALRRRSRAKRQGSAEVLADVKDSDASEEEEEEGERKIRQATVAHGVVAGRQAFLKGIKQNPGSAALLTDYFAFELDAADYKRWRAQQKQKQQPAAGEGSGRLAAIVWETVRAKFGSRLDVVERCAQLVERVGWLSRDQAWVAELQDLHETLLQSAQQEAGAARPRPQVPRVGPGAHSDPARQVAEFEEALAEGGEGAARKVWATAADAGWASVPLFRKMLALEAARCDARERLQRVRAECERMAVLGGSESAEFWLAYVDLEQRWDPTRVGQLDWRARKALKAGALNTYSARRAVAAFL